MLASLAALLSLAAGSVPPATAASSVAAEPGVPARLIPDRCVGYLQATSLDGIAPDTLLAAAEPMVEGLAAAVDELRGLPPESSFARIDRTRPVAYCLSVDASGGALTPTLVLPVSAPERFVLGPAAEEQGIRAVASGGWIGLSGVPGYALAAGARPIAEGLAESDLVFRLDLGRADELGWTAGRDAARGRNAELQMLIGGSLPDRRRDSVLVEACRFYATHLSVRAGRVVWQQRVAGSPGNPRFGESQPEVRDVLIGLGAIVGTDAEMTEVQSAERGAKRASRAAKLTYAGRVADEYHAGTFVSAEQIRAMREGIERELTGQDGRARSCSRRELERRISGDWDRIGAGLREYARQNGRVFPAQLAHLVEHDQSGKPYVPGGAIPLDPWRRAYLYEPPGGERVTPRLATLGRDGRPGGEGEDADLDNSMDFALR